MTKLSIAGEKFLLNGVPSHEGRVYDGRDVEGLLFNVRAVQATFDDATEATRDQWAYPDTGVWDAERNVRELCDALPAWRDHGVLAFTVNLQGGGPRYLPEVYQAFDNNGFKPSGDLKRSYADRMARVIATADELGMVVILGIFYWVHVGGLEGDGAVYRAAESALQEEPVRRQDFELIDPGPGVPRGDDVAVAAQPPLDPPAADALVGVARVIGALVLVEPIIGNVQRIVDGRVRQVAEKRLVVLLIVDVVNELVGVELGRVEALW